MKRNWTHEMIREGFDRFLIEQGRLPRAPEVDKLEYLPSSRWIQLKFGGLEVLRSKLGYKETHFGKGLFRTQTANRINVRGRNAEVVLEKSLKDTFGEVFVHTEKFFDTTKNRVDFYVYCPDGNFGVDVFCTDTMSHLQSIINIKMKKYENFPTLLFFVVENNNFKQEDLDTYARNKTNPLPCNIRMATVETLMGFIKTKRNYPNPSNSATEVEAT